MTSVMLGKELKYISPFPFGTAVILLFPTIIKLIDVLENILEGTSYSSNMKID